MLIKEKELDKRSACTFGGSGINKNVSHGYNAYGKVVLSLCVPDFVASYNTISAEHAWARTLTLVLLSLIIFCCLEAFFGL